MSENNETPSSIEIFEQPNEMERGKVLHLTSVSKTGISARLDEALVQMKRVNRSSDLVPLTQDYNVMRGELRNLLVLTKTYKASILAMDKARLQVSCK